MGSLLDILFSISFVTSSSFHLPTILFQYRVHKFLHPYTKIGYPAKVVPDILSCTTHPPNRILQTFPNLQSPTRGSLMSRNFRTPPEESSCRPREEEERKIHTQPTITETNQACCCCSFLIFLPSFFHYGRPSKPYPYLLNPSLKFGNSGAVCMTVQTKLAP